MTKSNFSATDSALGYLYQVRLALLSSLQRLRNGEVFSVYLETMDDVVFDPKGSPADLLQLKHHCSRAANLTDASSDLWKSLRVWIEGREQGTIPEDAQLYLITTSDVGPRAAASFLMSENRNETEAIKKLNDTVATSTNKTNEAAYNLFKGLSNEAQEFLIQSLTIIPNSPNISDINDDLCSQVWSAVKRSHINSFLTRLEGWWYRRTIKQLSSTEMEPILSNEIEATVDDLREQFKSEALPVDEDILDSEIDSEIYADRIFVQQVRLAGIGNKRILAAIRDYYRAFEQRSRWIREDLLLVGELDRYEALLTEEWELQFEQVSDDLGCEVAENVKQRAAKEIYRWVENSCYPIRPQVQHPSMTRGSFHILSDTLRIGWHPEFEQRLQRVLEPQGVK